MDKHSLIKRTKDLLRLLGINVAVFLGLFILFEAALHVISPKQNPLLGPPFVPSKVRVAHPIYSHGLRPNYEDEEQWSIARRKIVTNSLGFRDAKICEVPLRSDRKRVLFMGDSFVKGVGLPYEETFVGRFAAAFPQMDVLNGGVVSYSPSVTIRKRGTYSSRGPNSMKSSSISTFPMFRTRHWHTGLETMAWSKASP